MQIQYNITRIEEWCKSHDMPEGTLQLEHLMQATKLLQLKKVSLPQLDRHQDAHRIHAGILRRHPDHLRCVLDSHPIADPENVQ
jgi:myosin heavy subunit